MALVGIRKSVIYEPTEELVHESGASPIPRVNRNLYIAKGPLRAYDDRMGLPGPYLSTLDWLDWLHVSEGLAIPRWDEVGYDIPSKVLPAYERSYSRMISRHDALTPGMLAELLRPLYGSNTEEALRRIGQAFEEDYPQAPDLRDLLRASAGAGEGTPPE